MSSKGIKFKDSEGNSIYPCPFFPVGSIYLSITDTNPSTYFGGTWEQIAKGRTLVGVDTSDSDFSEAEKTGGEKTHKLTIAEMPKHKHKTVGCANGASGSYYSAYINTTGAVNWTDNVTDSSKYTGGDGSHNNLQPYFTCYMWCRTA